MKIGIIGGSGLYDIEGIENLQEITVATPFGDPSDAYIQGCISGAEVVFLPRHARGHTILPGELNHQANIFGLKKLGVGAIVSISAVGSFREELAPGDVVLVDQFVDRTKRGLDHTFFGNGIAAHVSFAHPTCKDLRSTIEKTVASILAGDNPNNITCHVGGTYLNMEGPAFSTQAESLLYKSWGMDVIGMTNMAEARLAREAEMCYQTVAMVTDYDCWHEVEHGIVDVEQIIATLMQNAAFAKEMIRQVVPEIARQSVCEDCSNALATAIITDRAKIPEERKKALAPIIGKYVQ